MSIAFMDYGETEKRILAMMARPAEKSKCQECRMGETIYVPCGNPAEFIIENRGEKVDMCGACANHNVKNRGANFLLSNGETMGRPSPTGRDMNLLRNQPKPQWNWPK